MVIKGIVQQSDSADVPRCVKDPHDKYDHGLWTTATQARSTARRLQICRCQELLETSYEDVFSLADEIRQHVVLQTVPRSCAVVSDADNYAQGIKAKMTDYGLWFVSVFVD